MSTTSDATETAPKPKRTPKVAVKTEAATAVAPRAKKGGTT